MDNPEIGQFIIDADFGIIDRSAVISWADNIVSSSDSPDIHIIDLSLLGNGDSYEIQKALINIYTGTYTVGMVASSLLHCLASVRDEKSYVKLNGMFLEYIRYERVPLSPELKNLLYHFDHIIDDGGLENGWASEQDVVDLLNEIEVTFKNLAHTDV